jgi:cyclic pyranopterin phosphate synthase
VPKGDVLAVARVAGIAGAKRTPELVPLCHPVALTGVEVDLEIEASGIRVTATARAQDRTGVEMEALTAAAVGALCLYDTAKAFDRAAVISDVHLVSKHGGRGGDYQA